MLTQTFLHIPGVGATTERSLWKQGCASWSDLLTRPDDFNVNGAARADIEKCLGHSQRALDKREHQYFRKALGLAEAWRAFPDFRDSVVYLDIETDGGFRGDAITIVGLFDGKDYTVLQKNVDLGNFPDIISQYSMIVTFFGSGFDLPMLQKKFFGIKFDQIHIDLCPTLKRLGYRGGLKRIEKEVGISRGDDTVGLSGADAITLWRKFQTGDEAALQTLIAYNREDVVNLEKLAELAFQKHKQRTIGSVTESLPL